MKRYLLTVLLALDQFVNAIFGGYVDETISYRLALDASKGKWYGCLFCRLIEIVWPSHCDMSRPTKAQSLARPGADPSLIDGGV